MEQVRLIEPNGTDHLIVAMSYAIQYCKQHPGWSWRHLTEEEIDALV